MTALGNCQLFTYVVFHTPLPISSLFPSYTYVSMFPTNAPRTPTCTLLPNQRNMMVYYGLGGMSHTRGMTEGEIKSMKCFIEGKPTSMVDYNEDD